MRTTNIILGINSLVLVIILTLLFGPMLWNRQPQQRQMPPPGPLIVPLDTQGAPWATSTKFIDGRTQKPILDLPAPAQLTAPKSPKDFSAVLYTDDGKKWQANWTPAK